MEKAKTSRLLLIFGAVCIACALVFSFVATSSAKEQDASLTSSQTSESENCDVYRLYNQYTGEHLYTLSADEYDALGTAGWTQEGTSWVAPETSETPVYRLYNQYTSDHHYTKDENEYKTLGEIGWTQEGVAFHSDDAKGVAIFRVYNPYVTIGSHHFTSDTMEYRTLASIGWTPESVAFYGVDPNAGDPLPEESIKLDIEEVTFDGEAKTPKVTIEGLTEGTDFEVVYPEDMTNAGEKTITIKGIGKYAGTVTKTFKIDPKEVTSEQLDALTIDTSSFDATYSGSEKAPEITGDVLTGLTKGTDYEVTYENTTNASTEGNPAKATITFKGNYSGEKTIEFAIEPLELTSENTQVSLTTALTYNGNEQTQPVAGISVGDLKLSDSEDYTITGNAATDAGEHEMTIAGAGNFSGKVTYKYSIAALDIANAEVTLGDALTYNGREQTQKVASVKVNGLTLDDTQYAVSDNKKTDAGDYKLTVTAVLGGNFTGVAYKQFSIAKAIPTVTFTDGATADSPVTVDQDEENSDTGISNFVCFNDDKADCNKVHPAYTVTFNGNNVAGTLSFTTGEGDDFSVKTAQDAASAYGVTFTPSDIKNYETVIGKGSSATAPVVYVQVTEAGSSSAGYFMASTSLMTKDAVAGYSDSNNNPVSALTNLNERATALDAAVKSAANSDSSLTYISAEQIQKDVATIKEELKGSTTNDSFVPNQTTQPTAYKYYQYMKSDNVHLYTTYGSQESDWVDNTASAADANKYAEFRIINVGSHQYDASGNTDGSTLTFHATHYLPTAYQMAASASNANGWGGTTVTLRNKLQKAALKTSGVTDAAETDGKNGTIYSKFNSTFTSAIKAVKKSYRATYNNASSATTSTDALWLLSYSEIASGCSGEYASDKAPSKNEEGTRYQYFSAKNTKGSDENAHLKYTTRAGASASGAYCGDVNWWLRSPDTEISGEFLAVDSEGDPSYDYSANYSLGVAPAFCM